MAESNQEAQNFESEMQEIISAPPPWLVRWGLTIFFMILLTLIVMSAIIAYPDIIRTTLTVRAENSPKSIKARISGRITQILVSDNQMVQPGQDLAYLESIGSHHKILSLLAELRIIQERFFNSKSISTNLLNSSETTDLGEIQGAYQLFYQSVLNYNESTNGARQQTRTYLDQDILTISKQRKNLEEQKLLQQREFNIAVQEFDKYKSLYKKKVVAEIELKDQERKYIEKQYPLQKTEAELLANNNSLYDKKKEIMQLENQIANEKLIFGQALNNIISEIENWKSKYVLTATQSGYVTYSGFIQVRQFVEENQVIFMLDAANSNFFGEMPVPQYNMGKVTLGQRVLIKLKSFPYQEYGIVQGNIIKISKLPIRDSVYLTMVRISKNDPTLLKNKIKLSSEMTADAEIVTSNASLLQRLFRNITKIVK